MIESPLFPPPPRSWPPRFVRCQGFSPPALLWVGTSHAPFPGQGEVFPAHTGTCFSPPQTLLLHLRGFFSRCGLFLPTSGPPFSGLFPKIAPIFLMFLFSVSIFWVPNPSLNNYPPKCIPPPKLFKGIWPLRLAGFFQTLKPYPFFFPFFPCCF